MQARAFDGGDAGFAGEDDVPAGRLAWPPVMVKSPLSSVRCRWMMGYVFRDTLPRPARISVPSFKEWVTYLVCPGDSSRARPFPGSQ